MANFIVKDGIVTIHDFVSHVVSDSTAQLCHKAAIDDTEMDGMAMFQESTVFQKQLVPMSHSLQTLALCNRNTSQNSIYLPYVS